MTQPTVYLMIAGEAIAYDESGEILSTVEFTSEGEPIWEDASVCDFRGGGGMTGYEALTSALSHAEKNAELCGFLELDRVSLPPPRSQVRPE